MAAHNNRGDVPSRSVSSHALLVERIRQGDQEAWAQFVAEYEGRLLAFIEPRVPTVQDAEDIVQETLIGFLRSLPSYDPRRDLSSYLFAIAAHKLTDWLRRNGRRPWDSASSVDDHGRPLEEFSGPGRTASTILRSREGHAQDEQRLAAALAQLVRRWKEQGQWERLKCIELLFVRGWRNKDVAAALGMGEQQVANLKFQTIAQLKQLVGNVPAVLKLEESS